MIFAFGISLFWSCVISSSFNKGGDVNGEGFNDTFSIFLFNRNVFWILFQY